MYKKTRLETLYNCCHWFDHCDFNDPRFQLGDPTEWTSSPCCKQLLAFKAHVKTIAAAYFCDDVVGANTMISVPTARILQEWAAKQKWFRTGDKSFRDAIVEQKSIQAVGDTELADIAAQRYTKSPEWYQAADLALKWGQ